MHNHYPNNRVSE